MSDLIDRQNAINAISKKQDTVFERDAEIDTAVLYVYSECKAIIKELPSVQPTHPTSSNTLGALDCVDRRLVSYKLTDLVNEFEEILSHIREREENDSVCGLCEYDGAYMGQSGDWCNECPGFDKADCFKLKDKYKKEWLELMNTLPSVQPRKWIPISVKLPEKRQDVIVTVNDGMIYTDTDEWIGTGFFAYGHNVVAWQSLPDPWKGEEE